MSDLCDARLSQLLIIDLQERLLGAMPETDKQQVLDNTQRLIKAANLLDIPVVLSEQYPKGLGPTHADISAQLKSSAIEKTCFSCNGASSFRENITRANRKQLIITGIEAHVCVLQTALEFKQLGYDIFVVEDAVCSRDPAHKANAVNRLRQAGIIISNHESVLFEWLRDAKHPQFKSISSLLK